jgi:hypothetical protein
LGASGSEIFVSDVSVLGISGLGVASFSGTSSFSGVLGCSRTLICPEGVVSGLGVTGIEDGFWALDASVLDFSAGTGLGMGLEVGRALTSGAEVGAGGTGGTI